ncbi:MAG: hypothetical protein ACHP93_03090 [Solirubrobacterales bacterium]
MRRSGVLATALVGVLVAWTSATDARARHKASPKCPPAGAHTIAADPQAQVFESAESTRLSGPYEPSEIFGCTYVHRRSYRLGGTPYIDKGGSGGVKEERLTGSIVAYVESYGGAVESGDCGGTRVYVRDLRNGRLLVNLPSGVKLQPNPLRLNPPHEGCEAVGVGEVRAIVVTSGGAVAWTAFDFRRDIVLLGTLPNASPPYPHYFDLYAADKAGERLLASGTEIDPDSLALAGNTLYWTEGGKPLSAPVN